MGLLHREILLGYLADMLAVIAVARVADPRDNLHK